MEEEVKWVWEGGGGGLGLGGGRREPVMMERLPGGLAGALPAFARGYEQMVPDLPQTGLEALTAAHLEELARLESELHALWEGLDTAVDVHKPG